MSNTTSVDNPVPAARKISPFQRMIDDMTVRNFATNTILCYLKQVTCFAQRFGKSGNARISLETSDARATHSTTPFSV
jgi:hypothetical protein